MRDRSMALWCGLGVVGMAVQTACTRLDPYTREEKVSSATKGVAMGECRTHHRPNNELTNYAVASSVRSVFSARCSS